MRLVRRHRLDDPRITDEARSVLVRAAAEQRRKAWLARHRDASDLQSWMAQPRDVAIAYAPCDAESSQNPPQVLRNIVPTHVTIDLIQKRVSEHFYLRELRDPDLKINSNRRVFVFPRQLAMYIVKQLTGASLQEIGRQFGGRHHTTVLHSINKVDEMRRSDKALNRTITELSEACAH
jgi:hypothetical protein